MSAIRDTFIKVARWEGWSYLLLMFVAMPLKYVFDQPMAVRVVGMAHGVLFIAYVIILILAMRDQRWSMKIGFWCFVASLLPFGTMVMEKRLPPPLEHSAG